MALIALGLWYLNNRDVAIYCVDFSTFKAPKEWIVNHEQLMKIMRNQDCFTEDSLTFMEKILLQSGVGEATAWPPGIIKCLEKGIVADRSAKAAREEADIVMTDVVAQLLKKTNTKPSEIDILVINCSLFSPTPSLCSMVINKFGMRSDIMSYNLSGMGCSAGVISLELAKNVLSSRPNSLALIISTETITPNLYHGNEREFLLQNTLFRCGGAAILLSNKWTDAYRSWFKLLHCVRTQYIKEESFGCVLEDEDAHRHRGVKLSKDIVKVAGRAMEKNFTSMGPYVLPFSEQFFTAISIIRVYLHKRFSKKVKNEDGTYTFRTPAPVPYVPDFKRGIDHFCIHAGGRAVIDGIEKNLSLTPTHVLASRETLRTYGNTSSSSIWYEMDFIRQNMDMKSGQRVLQIAFGSGFKCNSAAWLCLRHNRSTRVNSASSDDSKDD